MSDQHTEGTPTLAGLFSLMETIRTEVRQVAERQETLQQEVSEIAKLSRRIELKVGTIYDDMVEIRGVLREHEARLQNLV